MLLPVAEVWSVKLPKADFGGPRCGCHLSEKRVVLPKWARKTCPMWSDFDSEWVWTAWTLSEVTSARNGHESGSPVELVANHNRLRLIGFGGLNRKLYDLIGVQSSFPVECMETVVTCSLGAGFQIFQVLILPCNERNTMCVWITDLNLCVFL